MTVVNGASVMGGKTLTGTQTYTVVIDPDTALEEIVDVTLYASGNTLTITRGVDGPNPGTGVAHSAGAVVRHMAIGRDYQESNDHINETTTAHGLTITDVVTTTNTKTLTNKTLTSPKINENVALTATSTEINTLDGITASTAELNILDGVTATTAELNYVDGVTSAIQTQLDGKQPVISGVSNIEIGYLDGVTSAIQTQIDAKAPIASPTFTGTVTLPDGTVTSAMIANGTIVNADINDSAAIAKTKLDLGGTITSADIVDGTIVASDIADGTITAAKLVSDPYARANHTGTQTASTVSDFDTQVRINRLDQMAAPTASVSLNSQKVTFLATPTDNADAATKLYVDTKVADLVNSAPSTLDTLGEIATAIEAGGTVYESFVLKAGSTMTGALTLSGAPTVDLHAATKAYVDTVAGSATAAAASAAAAATSYDDFDDRYLGAKSTAPSVDNDGDALQTGAIYWNSVANAMFAWTGTEWGSISSTAAIYRYRFTAAGGETTISGLDDNGLTLSYLPGKEQVYLNGVLLVRTTDYTASNGTSLTSLAALAASDILEVITFTSFELALAIEETIFDAKGDILVGTAADTVGKVSVGTNGQYLSADSSAATGLAWVTPAAGYSAPTLGSTSIASGATVTTIAGLTLTSPVINTATATGAILVAPEERTTISATAATGTINFDAVTQGVLYYTTNASANWTLNVRGDSGTTLNSILATGDAITVSFLVTNGGTAYYQTAFQVDGSAVTPKYSGGTAPAAGNASSIDVYTYTILKTANATFTVFGAGPIKYA
jgi:hypothetical protein